MRRLGCLLLASLIWCGAPGGTTATAQDAALARRYQNLKTADYLGELKIEATITAPKAFTEGPAVDPQGNVFFTNHSTNPGPQIFRWDVKTSELSLFRDKSNGANGLIFDSQARLIACEASKDDQGRVTRTDLKTGQITVLADSYKGHGLGAPNDVTLDAKGRIYFSSRLPNTDPAKGNVNSVYRIDPDGSLHRILASPDIDMPNGLDTSPDDKTLYVVESDGRANRSRSLKAYDLAADGTVSHGRVFFNYYPGRSGDGLCLDVQGNLYVAAGLHKTRGTSETLDTKPGIHVITPQGQLVAFLETPEDTITNCTFGGPDHKTLYITCGKYLLSTRTTIPGRPAFFTKPNGQR